MRLSFAGVRPSVSIPPGGINIGTAADNDVCLDARGLLPHHLKITNDQRGLLLTVSGPNTLLNGRRVREKAILRLGDQIRAGEVDMFICEGKNERPTPPPESHEDERSTVQRKVAKACLRGVSGDFQGKVVPLIGVITIGRSRRCDVTLESPQLSRMHASVEATSSGIYLRDLGSSNGTFVNGNRTRDTELNPGDQIAFDTQRFVVEAPGFKAEKSTHHEVHTPAEAFKAPKTGNLKERLIIGACVVVSAALLLVLGLRFNWF